MTLEFLEIMEEIKRRKLQRSFKSNTRIYDDGSIEVDPQAKGEPLQKDVKKVGKSKRYGFLSQGAGKSDEGHSD